jgi:tetratricopeptide (TPR) repeat protein
MGAAQYYMGQGQHGSAIVHLEMATRLQPEVPLIWIALGDARALVGASDAARGAYARARRLAPEDPRIDRGLAQLLIREGRLEEARRLLVKALARQPDSVDLRLALGNLYLATNRPQRSIETLEPAAAAHPGVADVHYLLGQAHERNLHIQAALREQRRAVAADPAFAEAHGRIGIYLIDLTRYAEARAPLQEAIRLSPREPHYYWALGDSYLLDATSPENLTRAIALYRRALGLDPRNEKALMSLAIALTRRAAGREREAPSSAGARESGDLEEAARLLEAVVRRNPSHDSAYYKLYETNARLGRQAAARAALARFRALERQGRRRTAHRFQSVSFVDSAGAHVRLGRRYLAEGRPGLAAREFRLALERDPSSAAARAGLAAARQGRVEGRVSPQSREERNANLEKGNG